APEASAGGEAVAEAPAESAAAEPPAEALSPANECEAAYNGLLPTLEVDLQQLHAHNPDAAAPIQQSVDYAKVYAQSSDFTNAYAGLEQAAQELAKVPAESAAAEPPAEALSPANEYEAAYNGL